MRRLRAHLFSFPSSDCSSRNCLFTFGLGGSAAVEEADARETKEGGPSDNKVDTAELARETDGLGLFKMKWYVTKN